MTPIGDGLGLELRPNRCHHPRRVLRITFVALRLERLEVGRRRSRDARYNGVPEIPSTGELRLGEKEEQTLVMTTKGVECWRLGYGEIREESRSRVRIPSILVALEPNRLVCVANDSLKRQAGAAEFLEAAAHERGTQLRCQNAVELRRFQMQRVLGGDQECLQRVAERWRAGVELREMSPGIDEGADTAENVQGTGDVQTSPSPSLTHVNLLAMASLNLADICSR